MVRGVTLERKLYEFGSYSRKYFVLTNEEENFSHEWLELFRHQYLIKVLWFFHVFMSFSDGSQRCVASIFSP